jgi:hypothetical protein
MLYFIVSEFQYCDEAPEANHSSILGVASDLVRAKEMTLRAANKVMGESQVIVTETYPIDSAWAALDKDDAAQLAFVCFVYTADHPDHYRTKFSVYAMPVDTLQASAVRFGGCYPPTR